MKNVVRVIVFLLLVLTTTMASANLVTNGSFEVGTDPGSFLPIAGPDNSTITGWTITGGIDYIGSYWTASDGQRSLDMNGYYTAGAISQIFGTTAGQQYNVLFDLAGNTDGGPTIKTLIADALGSALATYTFDITGKSHGNMGWETESYSFIALSNSTLITFFSPNDPTGAFGPALDNVRVNAVPEPSIFLLFGAGLAGVGFLRRKIKL